MKNYFLQWGLIGGLILTSALILSPLPSRALVFNITYDSSVTNQPNAAQIEAAYGVVTQAYSALFTNNITLDITVIWGESGFGNSGLGLVGNPSYVQLTNALKAAETTAADSNAVASLPASNPISSVWWIPNCESKALTQIATLFGINPNDTIDSDGQVMFASNLVTWAFSPTNRAVPGEYDFIAVAEHETSEVMGRVFDMGVNPGGYIPYDLFRFTNGVRTLDATNTGVYFSINGGVTLLKPFHPVPTPPFTSDIQDWQPTNAPDSFDYVLNPDTKATLSSADLIALSILGYNLNFTPPKLAVSKLSNGHFQVTFTNVTGLNFSVLATTNLALPITNWVNLGAPAEIPAGNYLLTDTNLPVSQVRFYRAVLQ